MNTDLLITLQNYWFSEKEAKVYLTTLELGNSIASTIARRSGINRVTTYSILNDLKKRWIANEITKDDVKYFSVISAELLFRKLEEKYESFKSKLPDFLAVADKFGNKPKVQFFEGLEWVKHMYNDLLICKKDIIYSFLWTHELDKRLKKYLDESFVKQRVKEWISAKVIISDHNLNKEYHEKHKHNMTDVLTIKEDIVSISNEINIYWWNKIMLVMFSSEEMSWIIIQSEKLYETFKNLFNFVWNTKTIWKKQKKR